MKYFTHLQLANTPYGSNAFGTDTYSGTQVEGTPIRTEPTPGATPAAPGSLANTGFDIIVPIALGVAIILAALVMLVKMHTSKTKKNRS